MADQTCCGFDVSTFTDKQKQALLTCPSNKKQIYYNLIIKRGPIIAERVKFRQEHPGITRHAMGSFSKVPHYQKKIIQPTLTEALYARILQLEARLDALEQLATTRTQSAPRKFGRCVMVTDV